MTSALGHFNDHLPMLANRAQVHIAEIFLDSDLADVVVVKVYYAAAAGHQPLRLGTSELGYHLGDRYRRVIHQLAIGRKGAALGISPNSVSRVLAIVNG
jgi:hypothetical protein